MSDWFAQTSLMKEIASQILLPKHNNYHEDFLSIFNKIQNVKVYKMSKLKQLNFKNFQVNNEFNEQLYSTIVINKQRRNQLCLIFLHGYCSNRLEGLSLLQSLPKQIDFCCFDFSSSGKSQGNLNTFGIKQFKDISTRIFIDFLGAIINQLKRNKYGYNNFILWGRSMGAVTSFLLTSSHEIQDKQLIKNVVFQVLDSPFSTFESIFYHQAKQFFKIPEAFIEIGVKILQNYFINHKKQQNPFNIDLNKAAIKCKTSSLFIFNQNDHIIPQKSSITIINNLPKTTYYQKFIINQNHNTLRKNQTIQQIFKIVRKNYLKWIYKQKGLFKNQQIFISPENKMKNKLFISNHLYLEQTKFKKSTKKIINDIKSKQTIASETYMTQNQYNNQQSKYIFRKTAIYCSLHKAPSSSIHNQLSNLIQKSKTVYEKDKIKINNQEI